MPRIPSSDNLTCPTKCTLSPSQPVSQLQIKYTNSSHSENSQLLFSDLKMDSSRASYYIVIEEDQEQFHFTNVDERTLLMDILDLEEGDELLSYYGQEVLGAYKRVDRRVKPVPGVFPEDARVERRFPEDPLLSLPPLSPHPPEFTSGERLTVERLEEMKINPDGFLWPEEEKLFAHILKLNEQALAFQESHRGTFREDYFTPILYQWYLMNLGNLQTFLYHLESKRKSYPY